MRYVFQYIIHNIPFLVGIIVLIAFLWYVFMRSSSKEYIRNNIFFCFLLCVMTLLTDCIFFWPVFTDGFAEFYELYKLWGVFVFITSTLFIMAAFAGVFAALRAIPLFGTLSMWLLWLIMTLPFRLYYASVNQYPTVQDVVNLLTVKLDTTLDTLSASLRVTGVLRAVLPAVLTLAAVKLFRALTKIRVNPNWKMRGSLILTGLLIAFAYHWGMSGRAAELVVRDSMSRSFYVLKNTVNSFNSYLIEREYLPSEPALRKPDDNVVFILDESVRGDYLSINNPEINTTPGLSKYMHDYPENIFNYGIMLSAATVSFPSRSAIIAGIDSLPDKELQTFRNPTVFDIAKANGYRTILINVQGDFPDIVLRESDMKRIDEVYLASGDFDGYRNYNADMNAAGFIRKRLNSEKGLFIFLEKVGAHILYENRYPGEETEHQIFMPKMRKNDFSLYDRKRIEVVNSYKNCLCYNIDRFFKALFGENPLMLENCTIIYTSDHGESLMEYNQTDSHGTGYFEQALVPFLIFSSNKWVLDNLLRPDEIHGSLTHLNIPPTISAIISRDLNYSSGAYNSLVSVESWNNPPLVYLKHGALWDGQISEPVSADSNGKIILRREKYLY